MENNRPPQTSNHDAPTVHTAHDGIGAPRAHEAPDNVPTAPMGDIPITTGVAHQAIVIVRTLSESMRRALKFAWTDKDSVLRLDNSVAKRCTRDALQRRELVDGFAVSILGRIVRAVLLTSEAEVLAHAQRSHVEAVARMNRDFAELSSGKYADTTTDEQLAAYRAFDWSTLGQPIPPTVEAERKDATEATKRTRTAGQTCIKDGHEDRPAVALLVHIGQGDHLGAAICRECATCKEPGCGQLGDTMDAEYEEPWCRRHADQFGPDERVSGPDIVPMTSERARPLLDK